MNITWKEEEKLLLLKLLEKYGVADISLLASKMPTKSAAEIKYALTLYERAGISQQNVIDKESHSNMPLDKWITILKEISNNQDISRDLTTALRLIALYEDETKSDVSLKECYIFLADLMSGKPTKKLNIESEQFLLTCIIRLAKVIEEDNLTKEVEFLASLKRSNLVSKAYTPKNGPVLLDPNLNLLKVPRDILKNKKTI